MNRFETVLAFFKFLGQRKKFWLIPIAVVVVILGLLLVLSHGSVVAPLIYPLF